MESKSTRTVDQILEQQRKEHGNIVPIKSAPPAPLNVNDGLNRLAEYASSGTVLRFSKDGEFIQPTNGDTVLAEGTELVCHWDQARTGFQRFNGPGQRPDVRIDLVFGGTPPRRGELGDTDPGQWSVSNLTGKIEDPWQTIMMVPLENSETGEIFVFQTSSRSGLRAVSNLLRQAARQASKDPNSLPVIKLQRGGYDHPKWGWVKIPAFAFVGKAPKTDIAAANTSVAADLDDDIPW